MSGMAKVCQTLVALSAATTGLAVTPALAQSDTEAQMIETIIVTARRREESLQSVPASITAATGEALQAKGVDNVEDLQFSVPNLTLYQSNDLNPNFIIRGIGSAARNVGFESAMGVYVDGVFLSRTNSFTQALTDIERVEVLRGPQGTLFGKNSTIGALNITTKRPGSRLEGEVLGEFGNLGIQRVRGGVRGPISEDVGAKLSFFTSQRDGYLKNGQSAGGAKRLDNEDAWGLRGELAWNPVETLNLSLKADYAKNDQTLAEGEVFEGMGFVPGKRTADVDNGNREKRVVKGVSVTAEQDLGEHQLISISALRYMRYGSPDGDIDDTPMDILNARYDDELDQFSQEFRIVSPTTGRFSYVAGIYFYHLDSAASRTAGLGKDTPLAGTGVTINAKVVTKAQAAYFNGEYRFTDQLSLSGGLRYTSERKSLSFAQDGIAAIGFPNVATVKDKLKDEDISPSATLSYAFTPVVMGYVRAAKGFKSGGWNPDFTTLNPFSTDQISFDAESITNYEAGLKSTLLDGRVRLNVALFEQRYKNIQVSQFVGGLVGFRTTNAGEARSRGFEADVIIAPARGLTFDGGIGYADAKYVDFRNATADGQDFTGEPLQAPRWTASLGAQYRHTLGSGDVVARLDYAYRSAVPADPTDPVSRLPGFSVVNARIGYEAEAGWGTQLWADNLLNEDYLIDRQTSGDLNLIGLSQVTGMYGPQRTYGVRLSYRF